MHKRLVKAVFYGAVLGMIFLLALQSETAITAVRGALRLCYRTVIPALFPFFVLSAMLTGSGFSRGAARLFSPVMGPLFRVSGAGALPFIIGLISGYPTGAKAAGDLVLSGRLTQEEGSRLLPFCNNSGPLFIIGAVGTGMLGSPSAGLYLYLVHIVSAVLVGLLLRFFSVGGSVHKDGNRAEKTYALQLFSASVSGSVTTMLTVCGFIVFFAAITACLEPVFTRLPPAAAMLMKGIMEVTNGVYLVSGAELAGRPMLAVISFLLGFGGLCVLMQVAAVTADTGIKLKLYVFGKLLQGVCSAALVYVTYPFCIRALQPVSVGAGRNTALLLDLPPVLTALPVLLLFIYLALRLRLRRRNKCN